MHITVYTRPGCHLCEDVLLLLDRLTPQYRLDVAEVNILDDMALYDAMSTAIPVVVAGDGRLGRLVAPVSEPELRAYLEMARRESLPSASVLPPYKETAFDRLASWIGKHWLKLALVIISLFVGLPWLAPIFAKLGMWGIADPIYTGYALTCHQLPERAGSLFGYQVAFCYRNTAIYAGIVLFGGLFGLARSGRVKWLRLLNVPLPWWLFVPLLLPMAADGLTHMLGLRDNMLDMDTEAIFGMFSVGSQAWSLNWWLRIITGLLAALGVVWFSFPRMDRAMQESEAQREMYVRSAASYQPSIADSAVINRANLTGN